MATRARRTAGDPAAGERARFVCQFCFPVLQIATVMEDATQRRINFVLERKQDDISEVGEILQHPQQILCPSLNWNSNSRTMTRVD
jgi:hypothetical protein